MDEEYEEAFDDFEIVDNDNDNHNNNDNINADNNDNINADNNENKSSTIKHISNNINELNNLDNDDIDEVEDEKFHKQDNNEDKPTSQRHEENKQSNQVEEVKETNEKAKGIGRKHENKNSMMEDDPKINQKTKTPVSKEYTHKDIIPLTSNEDNKNKLNNTLDLEETHNPHHVARESNVNNTNNMSKILSNMSNIEDDKDDKPVNGNKYGNGKHVDINEDHNLFTEPVDYSKGTSKLFNDNENMNHGLNRGNLTKLQIAEGYYNDVQNQIQKIMAMDDQIKNLESLGQVNNNNNKVYELLNKQNKSLLQNLDKINDILNIVLEASKLTRNKIERPPEKHTVPKNKKGNHSTGFSKQNNTSNTLSTNNNKMVDIYSKEYTRYETRFMTVSNPKYNENLEDTLNTLKSEVTQFEIENRKLLTLQKQSELVFDNKIKNPVYSLETDALNGECNALKFQTSKFMDTVQKNKEKQQQNEDKIKELNEWKTKLVLIAKESYGIDEKEFDSMVSKEKTLIEIKQQTDKKSDILTKMIQSNAKKFEGDITRNEKKIINLETRKSELIKELKMKKMIASENVNLVQKYYSIYNSNNMDFNDLYDNENLPHSRKENNSQAKKISRNIQEEIVEDNGELLETIEISKNQTKNSNFEKDIKCSNVSNVSNVNSNQQLVNENNNESNKVNNKVSTGQLIENKENQVVEKVEEKPAEEKKYITKGKPSFNFNFKNKEAKDSSTASLNLKGDESKTSLIKEEQTKNEETNNDGNTNNINNNNVNINNNTNANNNNTNNSNNANNANNANKAKNTTTEKSSLTQGKDTINEANDKQKDDVNDINFSTRRRQNKPEIENDKSKIETQSENQKPAKDEINEIRQELKKQDIKQEIKQETKQEIKENKDEIEEINVIFKTIL